MCGLFGLVRVSDDPAARERGNTVLRGLGVLSEERGRDASGLALVGLHPATAVSMPSTAQVGAVSTLIDGTYIVKDTVPFSKLPVAAVEPLLSQARVVLGHTRWATQGAADARQNASPLLAGVLVGTHNGDVAPSSVPGVASLRERALAETDSELLYLALERARRDRRSMVRVLRSVMGRAALAFVDRGRGDRVYLARTALSPLAVAWTGDGDLVWASNPDWFRQVAAANSGEVSFRNITLIPEGHLLTVDTATAQIVDTRRFTATCRESDLLLINTAVYREFTAGDKKADRALARHHVAQARLRSWPELTVLDEEVTGRVDSVDVSDGIDVEELEALCWAFGDFDHETYNDVLDTDEDTSWDLFEQLRVSVREGFRAGRTVPGFTWRDGVGPAWEPSLLGGAA